MASRISSKKIAAKGVEVKVGDKVARFFSSHELDGSQAPQWIHGKVSGFKLASGAKRAGKASTTWWTLSFERPASKPLCCNTEEVVLIMLHAADEFRLKRHALEKQLGKRLVVTWSEEDSDLSMTNWDNDLRTCVVHKYVASTQEFVLRFKCGYDKIVDGNAVVQLVDQSESFHASTKAKTKRSVAKANLEWGTLVDNAGPTHVVMPVDSSSKVQEVEDSIRLALAQREEQRRQAEEEALAKKLKTQEDHDRLMTKYAETIQQQRANILRSQEEHAAAAQLQAQKLHEEKEAAAALLQKQHDEAAELLQAQKLHEEKQVGDEVPTGDKT